MIIWLASYPRSGNTLLRIILKSVFELPSLSKHGDTDDIGAEPVLSAQVGHQALVGEWDKQYDRLRTSSELFLVKTHDGPQDDGKAIYIVRDGRASCLSFYHYLRDFPHLKANFSLKDVVAGFTPFGSWSDHLEDWQPLNRSQTLLLKYEDLISDPVPQVERIAAFLNRSPVRSWENNFAKLHEMNPRFFRDGGQQRAEVALAGDEAGIFWEQHADWMKKLDYGAETKRSKAARSAYRKWISSKGREFYNLSARTFDAEKMASDLHPQIDHLNNSLASTRIASAEIESRLRQTEQREAEQAAELRRKNEAFAAERAAENERLTQERNRAAAELQSAQDENAKLLQKWKETDQELRQVYEHRYAILSQLAETRRAVTSLERARNEIETAKAAVHARLFSEQLLTAQLHRKNHEKDLQHHGVQRQFAIELEAKNEASELLAAAVKELHTRLRMLLSSRLLHLGWLVGLGRTPYWNDPAADELTDLIDMASDATPNSARAILQKLDATLSPSQPVTNEMEVSLRHLAGKGFWPRVVLDVGAGKGHWSVLASELWTAAEFFMVDPIEASRADLQKLCDDSRFHYLQLALGNEAATVELKEGIDPDSTSLLLPDRTDHQRSQLVQVETIDQLLDSQKIKPPQLVKIDIQGFEIKALQGASKLFEYAEVFIIEANIFEFMPGCPRLHELIAFMAAREFYPFDFAGFLRRPHENDLGQVDVVFVNQRSPLVASNLWWSRESARSIYPVPPALLSGRVISVVICTRDPRPAILNRTLDSLEDQTISRDRFEVVIVDNGSQPPLEVMKLRGGREMEMSMVVEPVAGLGRARCTGIATAIGQLLVFVDDDNFLAADYLEKALAIGHREPRIGLFGGISEPELEVPIARWKMKLLAYLGVRNYGDQQITKMADRWGMWEPIGAGMVARRAVAERFVRMFEESADARLLGRCGASLLSGEDSLMARAAYRENYACSYQPALKLTHFLKATRLKTGYLARVMQGHGRSFVILHRAIGKPVPTMKWRSVAALLVYRLKEVGLAGFVTWQWEIGYARECRSPTKQIAVGIKQPIESLSPASLPLSVILCTRNPRADLLSRTLQSLDKQTLPEDDFELILVDNHSDLAITPPEARPYGVRLIQEPRTGHVFARMAGIKAARGAVLVFVDDDNFLSPDYLAQAVRIAREEESIGAFGGIAEPEFEHEPAAWKKPLMIYLAVRNCGPEIITSTEDRWGEWEPIGAGLVVRRDVAESFIRIIESWPGADRLGRSDRHLMSGDDALFSRAAHRMGYASSYQPALKLVHYMKKERLGLRYLARLLSGHGRTYVLLNLLMGTPVLPISIWHAVKLIGYRIKHDGWAGPLMWFWDLGRAMESRTHRHDPRAICEVAKPASAEAAVEPKAAANAA